MHTDLLMFSDMSKSSNSLRVQVEVDGDDSIRQSWMESSCLWHMEATRNKCVE